MTGEAVAAVGASSPARARAAVETGATSYEDVRLRLGDILKTSRSPRSGRPIQVPPALRVPPVSQDRH
jgi:hypothetical protein